MKLIILLLVTELCVSFTSAFYVNFVVLLHREWQWYLKWIPATLLFLQTVVFVWCDRNSYKSHLNICLAFGFLLCIAGDLLLIVDGDFYQLCGMLAFIGVYILFSSSINREAVYSSNRLSSSTNLINICLSFIIFPIIIIGVDVYIVSSMDYWTKYVIMIYLIIIAVIVGTVLYGFIVLRNFSSFLVFIGTTGLAVSDIILIINSTILNQDEVEMAVMMIYWISITFVSWAAYPWKS